MSGSPLPGVDVEDGSSVSVAGAVGAGGDMEGWVVSTVGEGLGVGVLRGSTDGVGVGVLDSDGVGVGVKVGVDEGSTVCDGSGVRLGSGVGVTLALGEELGSGLGFVKFRQSDSFVAM